MAQQPTKWQYGKLHAAIKLLKIEKEDKEIMVESYTGDSTKVSFSHLTRDQAGDLIDKLNAQINPTTTEEDAKQAIRRRIIAIAHQMGWQQYKDDLLVLKNGKPMADYTRIDAYCAQHTAAKKPLSKMTKEELTATAAQFNQYHLSTLNAKNK